MESEDQLFCDCTHGTAWSFLEGKARTVRGFRPVLFMGCSLSRVLYLQVWVLGRFNAQLHVAPSQSTLILRHMSFPSNLRNLKYTSYLIYFTNLRDKRLYQ